MGWILQNAIELNLSFGTKGPWYYGFVGENSIMSTIYFQKKKVYVCVFVEKKKQSEENMVILGGVSHC